MIEIKLRRGAEARRAVVAQVLAYASALYGLDVETLETEILVSELGGHGHTSLAALIAGDSGGEDFEPARFNDALHEVLPQVFPPRSCP